MSEATSELLAETNDIVREQLALAWREHTERVGEMLAAQWPERMERVIEETIAGLAARVEAEYQDALEARLQQSARAAQAARRELIQKLNQIVRRLRSFENERQWSNTLVDATRGFCGRAALFLIHDGKLHLETTRNFDDADLACDVPLDAAPAFAAAVQTRDMLVAMQSSGELSESIKAYLGESLDPDNAKCYLFPVATRQDVRAVLYADSGEVDVDALELLVATAGAAHDSRPATGSIAAPVSPLISIAAAPQLEIHPRAQRFARVQVAEIMLYQSEKVKNGRAAHDLYTSLKTEIDSARETFRREFLKASASMVDYLHLELVGTLANHDSEMLGKDYPGPMV